MLSPSIDSPNRTAPPWPFLLPYVTYVLHTLEELPGFASWASANFGPETTGSFAAYHIPLMLLVGLTGWQAMRTERTGWVLFATALQFQFALNALFHLTVWTATGEYAPGAVTGAVVSIPVTACYFTWIRRTRRISVGQTAWAMSIGTLIAAAAIGFLFL